MAVITELTQANVCRFYKSSDMVTSSIGLHFDYLAAHEAIRASGEPNATGLKINVPSGFNITWLMIIDQPARVVALVFLYHLPKDKESFVKVFYLVKVTMS